jgi:hypothetical protein
MHFPQALERMHACSYLVTPFVLYLQFFFRFINVSHRHRRLGFFRFRAPPPVKASDLCLDINAFEALSLGPRHCMESRTKAARHAHVQLRSVRFRPQERSVTAAHAIAILISAQYHRATGLGSTMNACLYIFIPGESALRVQQNITR